MTNLITLRGDDSAQAQSKSARPPDAFSFPLRPRPVASLQYQERGRRLRLVRCARHQIIATDGADQPQTDGQVGAGVTPLGGRSRLVKLKIAEGHPVGALPNRPPAAADAPSAAVGRPSSRGRAPSGCASVRLSAPRSAPWRGLARAAAFQIGTGGCGTPLPSRWSRFLGRRLGSAPADSGEARRAFSS